MTRTALAGLALAGLLAACGADGPPQPPQPATAPTGVSVSGDMRLGVVFGD